MFSLLNQEFKFKEIKKWYQNHLYSKNLYNKYRLHKNKKRNLTLLEILMVVFVKHYNNRKIMKQK